MSLNEVMTTMGTDVQSVVLSRNQAEAKPGEGTHKNQLLSRAVAVMFAFSAIRPRRSLADLSEELGVNKASLLRILRALEAEGLLRRSGNDYQLGARVLALSNVFLSTLSVQEEARPHLAKLARDCGQTVSLAVRNDFDVVYVAIEHAQSEVGIQSEIGGHHPANATALGKVMLAENSAEELRALLDRKALPKLTERTIADPEALISHLEQVRRQGYGVDDEERAIGIRCVAAPVRNHEGAVIAAVSISSPIFVMGVEDIEEFAGRVVDTANAISSDLGFAAGTQSI
ncbi:MAG: IclR family transcriptional regulator [Truepera sp.]|nr:IclR family transcriptional regulator [Truepera sp.]